MPRLSSSLLCSPFTLSQNLLELNLSFSETLKVKRGGANAKRIAMNDKNPVHAQQKFKKTFVW